MAEKSQETEALETENLDAGASAILNEELRQSEIYDEKKRQLNKNEKQAQERERQELNTLVSKINLDTKKAQEEYDKRLQEINNFYKAPLTKGEYKRSEQEIIKSVTEKRIAREPLTVWQGIALFFKTLFKPYKYELKLTRKYQEQNYKKNCHEPINVPEAIVMNRCAATKKKKAIEQIEKLDQAFGQFRKNAAQKLHQTKDKIETNREKRGDINDNQEMIYQEEYLQNRGAIMSKLYDYVGKKIDGDLKPLNGLLNLEDIKPVEYALDI